MEKVKYGLYSNKEYIKRGFTDRHDYFEFLAKKNFVSTARVIVIANTLGRAKDFNELPNAIVSWVRKQKNNPNAY